MAEKKGGRFGAFLKNKKYRPILVFGLVIIGGILIFSVLGGRRSSAANASAQAGVPIQGGPSEQAQLAMGQIQAGLVAQQTEAQTAYNIAALGAEVESARLATEQSIAQTANTAALETARLETAAALAATEAQLDSETQLGLAAFEAQKFEAQQRAEIEFGNQGVAVAGILAGRDVELERIGAEERLGERYFDNQAFALGRAKRKHVGAIWAGEAPELGTKTRAITGLIGGLFSDLRVKKDVKWSGVRDGQNWYTYFSQKTGDVEAGVMSNETAPEFQFPMGEHMGVDYIAMMAEGGEATYG